MPGAGPENGPEGLTHAPADVVRYEALHADAAPGGCAVSGVLRPGDAPYAAAVPTTAPVVPPADHTESVLIVLDAPTVEQPPSSPGYHRQDPRQPQLRVDDLGATRGDGVFETVGVFDGRPVQLEPHLDRLQHSGQLLDFPQIRTEVWHEAILAAIDAADGTELSVKAVLTRGVEGTGTATGWVLAFPAPESERARREGLDVVTISRGYSSDIAQTSPWLLQGAKTTSYAVHMAALREARRRGAEDVIFTSTDSYVLEGPTSTVVLRAGEELLTPATDQGILAGTTQDLLFRFAADHGIRAVARPVLKAELRTAEHVWLCSSVRLCAPVRAIDGRSLPIDTDLAEQFLGYARREG